MSKIVTEPSHPNTFKVSVFVLTIIIAFLGIFNLSNFAQAGNLGDAFGSGSALENTANTAGFAETTGQESLNNVIIDVIRTAITFMGIIFILLMLYGGYLWMTDQGNEQQVKKAKDIIIAALIGIAFVASAYAVSWFVVSVIGSRTLNEGAPAPEATNREQINE